MGSKQYMQLERFFLKFLKEVLVYLIMPLIMLYNMEILDSSHVGYEHTLEL